MDITDRIIKDYKTDRHIQDDYVLNEDEMYLINIIVQLIIKPDSVGKCNCKKKEFKHDVMFKYDDLC